MAPCLASATARMSYGQVEARANQTAHMLRGMGVGPDVPVCILMERSVEAYVSMLGVMKAGGAYVPLVSMPAAGLQMPACAELVCWACDCPVLRLRQHDLLFCNIAVGKGHQLQDFHPNECSQAEIIIRLGRFCITQLNPVISGGAQRKLHILCPSCM